MDSCPVFSGNFLIPSFSQETPCQKLRRTSCEWKKKDFITTHTLQVHDGTAFSKSFVGVQIKWPIRYCVQFPNYVLDPGLRACGKMEAVRPRPIPSNRQLFSFKVVFLNQELRIGRIPAS